MLEKFMENREYYLPPWLKEWSWGEVKRRVAREMLLRFSNICIM